MKFAKYVFLVAGIYGLLALLPLYFLKNTIGEQNPPAISHPEFFYGFVGVALAWQLVFLIVSRDPEKYDSLMIPSILEKLAWGVPGLVLYLQGQVSAPLFGVGLIDLFWGLLFSIAYYLTRHRK